MTPFPPNYCNSEVKGFQEKLWGKASQFITGVCARTDRQTHADSQTHRQPPHGHRAQECVCQESQTDRYTQTHKQPPHAHRQTHSPHMHTEARTEAHTDRHAGPPSHQAQQVPALQFPARPQGVLVAPGRAGRGADPRASRGRCAASAAASPSRGDGAGRRVGAAAWTAGRALPGGEQGTAETGQLCWELLGVLAGRACVATV